MRSAPSCSSYSRSCRSTRGPASTRSSRPRWPGAGRGSGAISPHLAIPPELDAICARATALEPGDRFPSAREMQEALERFLDGERDAERRRDLAHAHVDAAAKAFEAAARAGAAGEPDRARGMRELGAALALEPTNEGALRTLMRVLLDTTGEMPPEAEAELKAIEASDRAKAAGDSSLAYSFLLVSLPVLLVMHVEKPLLLAVLIIAGLITAGYMGWMSRTGNAGPRYMSWAVPLTFTQAGLMSCVFGPFVMVPGTAALMVASFLVNLRANPAVRRATPIFGLAAVFVPALLQLLGISSPSYVFEAGSIRIVSNLVTFRPLPAMLLLAMGSGLTIMATVFVVSRAVDSLVASERRSFAQAWRLRQILPGGTQVTSHAPPAAQVSPLQTGS
jgi:serine/threonine-protein kinase